MRTNYILAIDQGTSSTKTLVFNKKGEAIAKGSEPLHTNYLDHGFVEQDPEEIYSNVVKSVEKCLQQFREKGFDKRDIAGIGISNQRETFVVWDKEGKPLHPAIVWQCKRSVSICGELKKKGLSGKVQEKTGLMIDPYFSASKLIWLAQYSPGVNKAMAEGNAFFGTIDTWLLYKMTGGTVYATDYTNASRTLLFNLHTLQWDEELIDLFGLKGVYLPVVKPSSFEFGKTTLKGLFDGEVPVTAMIGDSHAAAFGEGCFEAGTAKATLGTGCSVLMNIGSKPVKQVNGSVTTICWSIDGRVDYALEGVIVSCGSAIEWLKNELGLFIDSADTEAMANAIPDNGGVFFIPAFSGLGSPYWQMDRKASIIGLSFGTNRNHITRAALESIGYQVKDVITAMEKDAGLSLKELMTDGGITSNQFVIQFIADQLNKKVNCIGMPDVSALGAAYLAGLQAGVFANIDALKKLNTARKTYEPSGNSRHTANYEAWVRIITERSV